MADERLLDFPAKTTPVPADIIYVGDSADSFEEVKSTIEEIISAYPALISIAELVTVANQMIYTTGANTYATTSLTVFARSLLDDASASAARTTLGLEIGVNVQAYSLALSNIAGLTTVANNLIYTTASDTYAVIAPVNSALLISSVAGVPSWANTGIPAFTMGGAINMNSNSITNVPAPSAGGDATNKTYVDNIVQNVHPACLAASTANLTATYANGASGVGATLTNAGAFAVFSIDGVSPSVGQRVLIKNQSSQLENGVYTVTVVGDAVSVNWVLTRATDYNEAADMQAGDKFAVVSGTTQGATEWMMTQTAAITVGTTAITFAEMGQVTAAVTSVVTQVFTANGTYTPTSGMVNCVVEIVGGGGGGGGSAAAAGEAGAGGGGGAAGYCRKFYTASQIGANAAVVIGAGGAGGAAGNNNGSNGNASTFTPSGGGVTLTANAGSLGNGHPGTTTTLQAIGGSAGTGSNGDVNIQGGFGSFGLVIDGASGIVVPSSGGSTPLGPTTAARGSVNGAEGAHGYGSGGMGGCAEDGNSAGSDGAGGICIVTEYVSTSA